MKQRTNKNRTKNFEQLNKEYFKSLIATRASTEMLWIAWVGILVGLIDLSMFWISVRQFGGNAPFDPATFAVLISLLFMICSQIVMLIKPLHKYFYQHQKFSSIWQFIFIVVLLFQLIVLSGNLTITGYDGKLDIYHSRTSIIFYLAISILYLLSIFYNIFWLRSQLKKGMPEERRLQNFLAKPAVYGPASIAFIFFGILLLRGFTGGAIQSYLWFGNSCPFRSCLLETTC